jgi:6-phosphogluconolactonase
MSQFKILTVVPAVLCFAFILALGGLLPETRAAGQCLVYVGTYTDKGSKGIYLYRMDLNSGALTPAGLAAETPNPTFFDLDPQGRFLFAANEINNYQGQAAGEISSFAIAPGTGKLTPINQRSSEGAGPCHILVDHDCKAALVANYTGGSAAVLPINADGSLSAASTFIQYTGSSVNTNRQEAPHAHCVALDPAGRCAFVCDLGTDKVMQYLFDADRGKIVPNDPPFVSVKPGLGPRHITFAANGKFAYLINELGGSIIVFAYDSTRGLLSEIQTISTLPADFTGFNTCAEIALHPSGKFLYGSNRGHNSVALFTIDPASGKLTFVERTSTEGKIPRSFAIDPTGKFLVAANQDSNNLVVFNIDPETGRLKLNSQVTDIASPVCVKFLMVPGK